MNTKIFLASASPRRSEIMTLAGLSFRVIEPHCDEDTDERSPDKYVMELSRRKAEAGHELIRETVREDCCGDYIVIGADTIVFSDEKILGKPRDEEQAFEMLRALSGNTHEVYTGVTVKSQDTAVSFFEKTQVSFFDIPDGYLMDYVKTGEPMDKAGAYGIQGRGCFLVEKINGDYFNVMGLPIARLMKILRERSFI